MRLQAAPASASAGVAGVAAGVVAAAGVGAAAARRVSGGDSGSSVGAGAAGAGVAGRAAGPKIEDIFRCLAAVSLALPYDWGGEGFPREISPLLGFP